MAALPTVSKDKINISSIKEIAEFDRDLTHVEAMVDRLAEGFLWDPPRTQSDLDGWNHHVAEMEQTTAWLKVHLRQMKGLEKIHPEAMHQMAERNHQVAEKAKACAVDLTRKGLELYFVEEKPLTPLEDKLAQKIKNPLNHEMQAVAMMAVSRHLMEVSAAIEDNNAVLEPPQAAAVAEPIIDEGAVDDEPLVDDGGAVHDEPEYSDYDDPPTPNLSDIPLSDFEVEAPISGYRSKE